MKSNYNLPFLQKLLLILIILPMLSVTVFAQSTRYVNINVIGGNNNGTTWGNAYNNLQIALVAAQSGDKIWVAKGIYKPTQGTDRNISFVMKNGVAIYGGFSGNGTETQLSDRDFKNNVTTLSGDIGTVNVSTDNSYHVILNNFTQDIPLTSTAILDGFTISGGNANGAYPNFDGGGMYNQYASPTLNKLIFTSNNASRNGGGMVNFNSSAPSINYGTFSGNTASTGGAMNNQTSSNTILTNVSFLGNSATTNGGAVYNYNTVSPNLKNVIFSGNSADLGGAMYNEQRASPILSNCTFSGNRAITDGGGMYNINNSNPLIKNSIIWGNGIEITNISNSFPAYTKSIVKTKNLGSGVFAGNTDPLFVTQPFLLDAPTTAGDLRLQLCSPAINLGDNTGVTNKDLDGNNRIFENTVDLGAYEFQQNRNPTNVSVSSTLICDKTNINLLATCANGMVTWYNAATNGILLGTGSSFSYTPLVGVNQTFYASCVNANCESDRIATSITVTVNALPIPTASAVSPICAGTTLNLSSGNTGISTSNSYTWTGVNSFTSTTHNPSILNATTAATGTYQVIITNDKGCTATATTSATVNALPIPTASAVSPICAGTTLNLSSGNTGISTSNSYAWTGVNSFTSTAQNPSILNATTAATGTYQVIITNDKGCTATATTSAIVNGLPIPTASAVSPICAGMTLNLSSGNTGISTSNSYTWTGVNSFTSATQNPSILNATTAATGTCQVIITNDKGCTAMATTAAIVNGLPVPTASAVSPICAGTTLNLSSGNTGISTSNSYAWTGVNSFTSTAQNPSLLNATTAATGTYQVIITNDKGCTATATTSATVNALPVPTASAVSPICAGTTLNLSSGNTGISTSNSYAWTGVNSFTSTAQNPSLLNATTAATGTYQVIITNDKGCTATATTSATVNALPVPTASAVSPICAGTTLNLSSGNTGISTSNSYAWTGVNSFTSTAQNPSLLNATTAATGTYQVIITNDKGCTATATTSATINPTPETPTTQADTQIIFGGSVSLTATGCLSIGSVLKWYQTSDNQIVTMPVSPTATIQYYVKCEVTANGITCISNNSNNVTVTVLQPLPPVITGATICTGSNIMLTATGCSGSTGTFVLKWYQNSNDALVTMPVSPTSNTDYYAKCEQTFNSVTAISSKSNVATVTVLNPLAPVATGSTIYKGNSISLNATGCTGSGFIIKWYEASSNTLVTMPVSPISTSQYYAKCEQTADTVSCSSSVSNYVIVTVIRRVFVDISKINSSVQDGINWATAFSSLQDGLNQAKTAISLSYYPLEVWVAKGTYKPTTTTTRTIYFNMPNNVKVYGGFAGTENALNDRNFRTNTTILSADIGTVNLASDNSYHVVIFDGSTSNNTVLDGFTITGGYGNFDPKKITNISASLATPPITTIETGGGIVVQNAGMPTIANCLIVNNAAVMGGGIYASDASIPKVITCKVMSNQATFGAGVYFQNGSNGSLNNTLILGNRGTGVIYNNISNPTINNCTIAGNGGYNGGIFNSASQPIIKNSILWNNSTPFNDTQSIITYSTIQGGYSGAGNLNYDPQFVSPITDGLSPTISGDYHLKSSSLVIDRGENTDINLIDKDLDENLRRFNAGTVDMGAYEFQGAATSNIIISAQTGDWEINSTWVGFKIPTLCDVVIIDSNHIVTINTTGVAKSIQYRETGQIKFKTNLAQLNIGCN